MMPKKDGIETLHELRAQPENPNLQTPTVCLTANAISGAREQYLAAGFDDYLTKPIDADKLEEMLVRYLPPEKLKAPAAHAADALISSSDMPTILIADDDPMSCTLAANILGKSFRVEACHSGADTPKRAAVRAEIERCAGTQFDPEIAKVLLAMIDEDKDYVMTERTADIHVWRGSDKLWMFTEEQEGTAALSAAQETDEPEAELPDWLREVEEIDVFLTGRNDRESVMKVMQLKPDGYLLKSMPQESILASVDKFFETQKWENTFN